jgi:hypothetical protein
MASGGAVSANEPTAHCQSSFHLDVGCFDYLGPFSEFDLDVLSEFLRGTRNRFEAKHSKPTGRHNGSACRPVRGVRLPPPAAN